MSHRFHRRAIFVALALFLAVAGEFGPDLSHTVTINEFTTVSATYALSQFIHGAEIFGDSPGLENASAATGNLVDAPSGMPARVVSNSNNGVSNNLDKPSTLALQALNRFDEALTSYSKALELQKDYADAHFNQALALLTVGDFRRGFEEYEWRWRRTGMPAQGRGRPLWLGEYPLRGRTILLHGLIKKSQKTPQEELALAKTRLVKGSLKNDTIQRWTV